MTSRVASESFLSNDTRTFKVIEEDINKARVIKGCRMLDMRKNLTWQDLFMVNQSDSHRSKHEKTLGSKTLE